MLNKILTKPFCIALLAVSFVYGLVLPFMWGNDPSSEMGTLSLLCEDRKLYFWAWGLLVSFGIVLNAQYMYKSFSYKNKLLNALCVFSVLSVMGVAITLGHSIDSWNPKRILHWVATALFIVFLFAAIGLFFILNRKKYKSFNILIFCVCFILLTFVFIFAFIGKSALMEMIPVALMQIFLFVVNFTPIVKKDKEKALAESVKA